MVFLVEVITPLASGAIHVKANTVPEAFAQIPSVAANMGLALLNDGTPTTYVVSVVSALSSKSSA